MPRVCPPRFQLSVAYTPATAQQHSHSSHCSGLYGAMLWWVLPPLATTSSRVNGTAVSIHSASTGHRS